VAVFSARATGTGFGGGSRRVQGELLISSEAVVFTTTGHANPVRFAHTKPAITMDVARRCPPWSNTFLLLQDGGNQALVALSSLGRPRLRRALRGAGLKLTEQRSARPPRLAAGAKAGRIRP
jgi:hypothetical protein